MCVRVSSGKAYVRGYDVSLESSTILDVDKPRDKRTVDSSLVPYQMGTVFKVNHVSGVPAPNINDETALVELYNKRTTADNGQPGDKIGEARIYSFAVSASIALPRIMKSSPCLLGISLNNPAMTMKGQIPLFISGAENLASLTATA